MKYKLIVLSISIKNIAKDKQKNRFSFLSRGKYRKRGA